MRLNFEKLSDKEKELFNKAYQRELGFYCVSGKPKEFQLGFEKGMKEGYLAGLEAAKPLADIEPHRRAHAEIKRITKIDEKKKMRLINDYYFPLFFIFVFVCIYWIFFR